MTNFINKNDFFSHLHTLTNEIVEKFGSFSPKIFKLAFRVLNNSAQLPQKNATQFKIYQNQLENNQLTPII